MKIGILTYHSVYNFGANLQVYSTVGYLRNNGFEPIIINWIPNDMEAKSDKIIPPIQADAHKNFIKDNLPCTNICRTDADIVYEIEREHIKGIIIGSDALFKLKPFWSRVHLRRKGIFIEPTPPGQWRFPNPFWGSFIPLMKEHIPVIVMSVSSQNSAFKLIKGRTKKELNNALHKLSDITVRDNWTREMVAYLTKGTILPLITPDPVFAYNQNIKEQISKHELLDRFNIPERYILISFRTQNVVTKAWLRSFELLAEKSNLHCVALTMPDGIIFEHSFSTLIEPPLSPREWYGLIKFSSGYIGENMHAIVVALHNGIPFYSFDSYGILKYKFFVKDKSSKIYDILSQAGFLKNRISILGKRYKAPTPEFVIQRIKEFDSDNCIKFNISQLDKYNRMMNSILAFFHI